MASSTLQTCVEHKLTIEDDKEDRIDRVQRGQWLRAAILGSNDGLLSTTSLMLGMAAASEDRWDMMLSGVAAAVAGACSMAVGEYVSVATQRDIEEIGNTKNANSQLPRNESINLQLLPSPATKVSTSSLSMSPAVTTLGQKGQGEEAFKEVPENVGSMTPRRRSVASASPGNSPARRSLFMTPQRSPMMRVISEETRAETTDGVSEALPNPLKAGGASALAFLCGAIIPLISAMFVHNHNTRIMVLVMVTSIALAVFGGLGAHVGGSPVRISAMRVLVGGWIAMGVSYGLLKPFDKEKHQEAKDGL